MAECLKSEWSTIQLISHVISFINSQKGKLMLVLDDYIFKLNRQSKLPNIEYVQLTDVYIKFVQLWTIS